MMADFWQTVLQFAQGITEHVGTRLLSDFGQPRESFCKADGSLVTRSDQWADREIREAIGRSFPDHGVISEEATHTLPEREWCWVIDPLDGTTNFTRGLPLWGISLGLLYKGTPVFGYVQIPPLSQSFHGFWYGASGLSGPTGAFLNQQPIHSGSETMTANHLFNLCTRSTAVLQNSFPCKIRILGLTTYNFLTIAAGVATGGVEATPKVWDIAAVWAIVQAAGAVWVPLEPDPIFPLQAGQDYDRRPYPTLVVSHGGLVSTFQPLVAAIGKLG